MFRLSALALVAGCLWLGAAIANANMKPADGTAPIFRIFVAENATNGKIDLKGQAPAMVITEASDVALSRDKKAVRIILVRGDAKKFADITRKHAKGFIILEANGKVLEAMRITSPVPNGVLQFDYPDDAKVADYLRKRFHLK